ncbi:hypothetical protein ACFFX0_02935 [Citricoccus parietis]|uniref:Uncharacterized protein n=1 Tax=Citricoccus parietis TaxID=592307 RepID=A0ABV5FU40_9MICC
MHGAEPTEPDGAAGARDVDDLGVVDDPVDAHRGLLGAGEPIPAAAGARRRDQGQIAAQVRPGRGRLDREERRRPDHQGGYHAIDDHADAGST